MEGSALVWETLLRLIGAFYALTASLVLRQAAANAFLDMVLVGLGADVAPEEQRAERLRRAILIANGILIGIGGVWLMALSSLATVIFIVCAISYGAYLLVIAPRFLDPHDEPDAVGRAQTRNALLVYLAATAIVAAAQAGGLLAPIDALSPASFWLAVGLSALIPAYGGWLFFRHRLPGQKATLGVPQPSDEGDLPVQDPNPPPPAWRALLVPSWDQVLVDPSSFEPVYEIEGIDITDEERARMGDWQSLFMEIADPHDPARQRLLQPERQDELEALGRSIHESFLRKLPPDRILFEPLPRPHVPAVFPAAIRVMNNFACHPLWHDGDVHVGDISPSELGLSSALTLDLLSWADEFEWSIDRKDPGGPSLWTAERYAEHDRQGKALAERLADELRRTGRGDVAVRYGPPPPAEATPDRS